MVVNNTKLGGLELTRGGGGGVHIIITLLFYAFHSTPGSVPSIGRSPLSSPTHGLLPRFGIKHFNAKIVIPAKTIQRVSFEIIHFPFS